MLETIMNELETLGNERTKKTYMSHGGREPVFGVTAGDLNKLIKKHKLKNNHELALELYATGNYDAMYLAGLIADSKKITRETVMLWLSGAYCWMIAEYTVGSVASETAFAMDLVRELIASDKELYASCGYSILSFYVAFAPDGALDKDELRSLIGKIEAEIHSSPDRVRYQMNSAITCIGTSVPDLYNEALAAGERIGKVTVDMGKTACKVPSITEKLIKAKEMNRVGFKRKTSRC
jgi:3-methyladenine DNA glycosylase AlkD